MLFINDYMEAINYPIKRGEYLTAKSWWRDSLGIKSTLNGGFQKYYPEDCKYIYEEFKKNKKHWESFYINSGITVGPVNGEQFFIEKMVRERLELKYLPDNWFTRMKENISSDELYYLDSKYSGDWLSMGDEFNTDIKIVHFMADNFNEKVIKKFTRFDY